MARDAHVIDIEDYPDLVRLIDELDAAGDPLVLRRRGENLAVISPLAKGASADEGRVHAVREALRRSAGGWRGIVDVDEFLRRNRESRDISGRPPVDL